MTLETQTTLRRELVVNARQILALVAVGLGVAGIPTKAEVQRWVQNLQA